MIKIDNVYALLLALIDFLKISETSVRFKDSGHTCTYRLSHFPFLISTYKLQQLSLQKNREHILVQDIFKKNTHKKQIFILIILIFFTPLNLLGAPETGYFKWEIGANCGSRGRTIANWLLILNEVHSTVLDASPSRTRWRGGIKGGIIPT